MKIETEFTKNQDVYLIDVNTTRDNNLNVSVVNKKTSKIEFAKHFTNMVEAMKWAEERINNAISTKS